MIHIIQASILWCLLALAFCSSSNGAFSLDNLYSLSSSQVVSFMNEGCLYTAQVVPELTDFLPQISVASRKAEIVFYKSALESMGCSSLITKKVLKSRGASQDALELCRQNLAESENLVSIPYFQCIHLHKYDKAVKALAHSKRLARIAATLLQVPSVRLYQTALFIKEPGFINQPTGWHVDLNQVPLDTNNFVTVWCPLENLDASSGDSILKYASGSHRDISFRHWYGQAAKDMDRLLVSRYLIQSPDKYQVGDCSWHHGWLYHAAPTQSSSSPQSSRKAFAISYVDAHARKLHANSVRFSRPFVPEDQLSYQSWFDQLQDHQIIDHPDLPVVFNFATNQQVDDGLFHTEL